MSFNQILSSFDEMSTLRLFICPVFDRGQFGYVVKPLKGLQRGLMFKPSHYPEILLLDNETAQLVISKVMSKDYKDTLNLPQTDFPMKANLSQREPEMLKAWDEKQIYQKIQEKNKTKTLLYPS